MGKFRILSTGSAKNQHVSAQKPLIFSTLPYHSSSTIYANATKCLRLALAESNGNSSEMGYVATTFRSKVIDQITKA